MRKTEAEGRHQMELGLRGRTAAITGGSKGIGRAIGEELASEGVNLRVSARNERDLEEVARSITQSHNVKVDTFATNLADARERDAFAHACADVDILVNCAGAIPGGGLDRVDEAAWRAAWDLKLFGYIGITRIVYDAMCLRKRGVIINIVGVGGVMTSAGYICGGPNNAALINFTISLGGASVRHGVRVCGVNPGPVATERMNYLVSIEEEKVPTAVRDEWRKNYFRAMAYGRGARPDEISGAVAFLASDRASYVSGAMLNIDGGIVARGGAPAVIES